jgi:hypothetical protein
MKLLLACMVTLALYFGVGCAVLLIYALILGQVDAAAIAFTGSLFCGLVVYLYN